MGRPKKDHHPVTIRMEQELYERMNDFCERSGQTKTVALERAIKEYIDNYDAMMDELQKKNRRKIMENKEHVVIPTLENIIKTHPERTEIFELDRLLARSGIPYLMPFWMEMSPEFWEVEPRYTMESFPWDRYHFMILIDGSTIDSADMVVQFDNDGAGKLLSLTDNNANGCILTKTGLKAIDAYAYISERYKPLK